MRTSRPLGSGIPHMGGGGNVAEIETGCNNDFQMGHMSHRNILEYSYMIMTSYCVIWHTYCYQNLLEADINTLIKHHSTQSSH